MSLQKILVLVAVALLIGGGQILFKQASKSLADTPGWTGLVRLARDPVFIAALFVYGSATVLWVWAIRDVPLGQAYSIMGMVFVFVPLLAWLILKEPLNWRMLTGGAVIGVGILISQS
jgi:drug/metabolite transporter (DMT)-like permease